MTTHDLRVLATSEPAAHRVPRPRPGVPAADVASGGPRVLQLLAPPSENHLAQRIQAILEVLSGLRAAAQIQSLVDPALFARLLAHGRLPTTRHRLGTLHLCHPADTALEAATTIQCGPRVLALAARFERNRTGWVCTRFHLLAPRTGPLRMVNQRPAA